MKLIREGIVMKVKVRWTKGDGGNTGIKETVKRNPRNHLSSWLSFKKGISLEKFPMMVSLTQIQMPTLVFNRHRQVNKSKAVRKKNEEILKMNDM